MKKGPHGGCLGFFMSGMRLYYQVLSGVVINHFKDSYCRAFFVAHVMLEPEVFTLLLVMYGGLADRICEKIPSRCTFF